MSEIKPLEATCRGCWSLGSACGTCERCEASRPSKDMQASACELLGEFRVIARECPYFHHVLRAGEHFGLSADQIALQAAILMHRRAKELEAMALRVLNTSPSPIVLQGAKE